MNPHRKNRFMPSVVFNYFTKRFESLLYYVGAVSERRTLNVLRAIRKIFARAFSFIGMIFSRFWSYVRSMIRADFRDICSPFVWLFNTVKGGSEALKVTRGRSRDIRWRRFQDALYRTWTKFKAPMGRSLNYFLPIIGVVVFVISMVNIANMKFALSLSCNGQFIGYVEDEQVYENAKTIIANRLVFEDQTSANLIPTVQYNIAVAGENALSSDAAIADTLLTVSGADITEATGLYVGGQFYGATVGKELLEDTLNSILQPYRDAVADEPDTEVKFSNKVETLDGVYPTDSVMPFDEMRDMILSPEESSIYYTVSEGDTLSKIAESAGLTIDQINELNPELPEELEEGSKILLSEGQPLLSVKTVRTITYTEAIPYDTIKTEDSRYYIGYQQVTQAGEEGEMLVTEEIEYENGHETKSTRVSEVVIKEPVDRLLTVGSKSLAGVIIQGTGSMAWPAPNFQFVSRGFSGGHNGIDIAIAMGSPIYAADSGVVTVSQWTDVGYGYYVIIDHGGGIQTLYGHNSQLLVSVGQTVSKGQPIALSGSTGYSTGPHLHFEVRINGTKVDPAPFIY
ncbi:MAG: peptidoglycan DD-metalloendopeptidase family protein [Oscillospiraceae bacterium]|nr:peptidoglycan DD-metalloendopeptidase family protein [Oscillospiraceae bacterium]